MTLLLARWLGFYLLIMGIFLLTRAPLLTKALTEIKNSPAYALLTGALNLIFGLFILIAKPDWQLNGLLVINILGLLTVLTGLIRLFMPSLFIKMIGKVKKVTFLYYGIISLIIGLFLLYQGFFR